MKVKCQGCDGRRNLNTNYPCAGCKGEGWIDDQCKTLAERVGLVTNYAFMVPMAVEPGPAMHLTVEYLNQVIADVEALEAMMLDAQTAYDKLWRHMHGAVRRTMSYCAHNGNTPRANVMVGDFVTAMPPFALADAITALRDAREKTKT